jgi:hypothetical protein
MPCISVRDPKSLSSADTSTLEEETTVRQWKTIVVGVDGSPGRRAAGRP